MLTLRHCVDSYRWAGPLVVTVVVVVAVVEYTRMCY